MKGGNVFEEINFQLSFYRRRIIPGLLSLSPACKDGIYVIYKAFIPRNSLLNRKSLIKIFFSVFSVNEEDLEKKRLQNEEEMRNHRCLATVLETGVGFLAVS